MTSYGGLEGNVEHSGGRLSLLKFRLKETIKFSNSNFVAAVLALVEIASTRLMKPYRASTFGTENFWVLSYRAFIVIYRRSSKRFK